MNRLALALVLSLVGCVDAPIAPELAPDAGSPVVVPEHDGSVLDPVRLPGNYHEDPGPPDAAVPDCGGAQ